MKFMLLIGGSLSEWDKLTPADWTASERAHAALIDELRASGEFLESNELDVSDAGARIVRTINGVVSAVIGPLHGAGDFASGYYLIDCVNIDRACEIAGKLRECRFAPIEVRQVGH
jgi:hypothetical protein